MSAFPVLPMPRSTRGDLPSLCCEWGSCRGDACASLGCKTHWCPLAHLAVGEKEAPRGRKEVALTCMTTWGLEAFSIPAGLVPPHPVPQMVPRATASHREVGVLRTQRQGRGIQNSPWPVSASATGPCCLSRPRAPAKLGVWFRIPADSLFFLTGLNTTPHP